MSRLNLVRILVGGIAAGVIVFFSDWLIHDMLLKAHWAVLMTSLGRPVAQEGGEATAMVFFALSSLCRGIAMAGIYAAIRAHFGPGPKTAVFAGLAVWAIMFPIPFAAQVPIHIFGKQMFLMWSLYEIVPAVVGGLVAGVLYKESVAAEAAKK